MWRIDNQGQVHFTGDFEIEILDQIRWSFDQCLVSSLRTVSGAKLEHMLALREEVEQEYAERMEELREMYRTEMDSQNEKYEAEKAKMRMLETSLQVNFFVQPVVPTLT